jgi:hypothetical protein
MIDMSIDTETVATDRELVEIESKARSRTVLHWPELVRAINRLRKAEAENERLMSDLKILEVPDTVVPVMGNVTPLLAEIEKLRHEISLLTAEIHMLRQRRLWGPPTRRRDDDD